jgi:hypothetical protein
MTYPVKRLLEDGTSTVLSINPVTKSWFLIDKSNRRFNEVEYLILNNEDVSTALYELMDQSKQIVDETSKIKDVQTKISAIKKASTTIKDYNQGLQSAYQLLKERAQNGTTLKLRDSVHSQTQEEIEYVNKHLEQYEQKLNDEQSKLENSKQSNLSNLPFVSSLKLKEIHSII